MGAIPLYHGHDVSFEWQSRQDRSMIEETSGGACRSSDAEGGDKGVGRSGRTNCAPAKAVTNAMAAHRRSGCISVADESKVDAGSRGRWHAVIFAKTAGFPAVRRVHLPGCLTHRVVPQRESKTPEIQPFIMARHKGSPGGYVHEPRLSF